MNRTCHAASVAVRAIGIVLLAATVTGGLGGCRAGSSDSDPEPTGGVSAPVDGDPSITSEDASPARAVGDVSPGELSDAVFSAGAVEEPALASVTGSVPNVDVKTTMEVLEVRRLASGTLLRLRLSAPETYALGLRTFTSGRFGSSNFVRDVYLDDPASGTRLLPLQFQDYRAACVCPYKPLEIGPDPVVLTAIFDSLPEGAATVTVSLAESGLVAADIPVDP